MRPLVAFEDLVIGYGRRVVAGPLTGSILAGRLHAILGANGAGKTTFLRTLMGLHPTLGGQIIRSSGVARAYVPQLASFDNGFPVAVREVVSMALPRGLGRVDRRERVREALTDVGMQTRGGMSFFRLSGGQRQRVLVARGLVARATLMALDEPTAGVDAASTAEIWRLLRGLVEGDAGRAVIVVTHDAAFAREHAHCLIEFHADRVEIRETGHA